MDHQICFEKIKIYISFIRVAWYNVNGIRISYKTITQGAIYMAVSYNKLWKLMIDRKLLKKDLTAMAGITTNAMAKMGKGENVSTEILGRICKVLNCRIEDIMEFIPEETEEVANEKI